MNYKVHTSMAISYFALFVNYLGVFASTTWWLLITGSFCPHACYKLQHAPDSETLKIVSHHGQVSVRQSAYRLHTSSASAYSVAGGEHAQSLLSLLFTIVGRRYDTLKNVMIEGRLAKNPGKFELSATRCNGTFDIHPDVCKKDGYDLSQKPEAMTEVYVTTMINVSL